MSDFLIVLQAVAVVGLVVRYVILTQRGERGRWVVAGVAAMLLLLLVMNLSKRNKTVEIEIPDGLYEQTTRKPK